LWITLRGVDNSKTGKNAQNGAIQQNSPKTPVAGLTPLDDAITHAVER
jgi:hypothetical protein